MLDMWQEINNEFSRSFNFTDFKTALAFVNSVGVLAEKANHHPDIELSWGKVTLHLSTHETGGITEKDKQLAKEIDKI